MLAAALTPEIPLRSAPSPDFPAITARIEHLPVPGKPVVVEAVEDPVESRRPRLPAAPVDADAAGARQEEAMSASLPLIPDPTVYAARDLDSYPRPVAPLDVERFAESGTGKPATVRFELTIDERGVVNDVVLAGSGPAGTTAAGLSAMLAAARFVPARKDGRAVKSRVLLSISLAAETGDR